MKKIRIIFLLLIIGAFSACKTKPMELPQAVSSGIEIGYDSFSVTASFLRDHPDEPNYIGGYDVPFLMNIEKDITDYYNLQMANQIKDKIQNQYAFFLDSYERLKKLGEKAIDAGDAEANKLEAELAQYYFRSEVKTVSDGEGYLAFASCITWSEDDGIRHKKVQVFNVDVREKKLLALSDLFQNEEYQTVLERKIKDLITQISSYQEDVYDESLTPTLPSEDQFFFSSDKLIVYYNPGEIAPEEKGVIYFEIPIEWMQNQLTERFALQSTIAVMRPSKLFAFTTRE